MMMATMATSTSSIPMLSLRTQPIRKFNNLSLYFTKNRMSINCKSSALQSLFPTKASSSSFSSSSSLADKTEPMVPPYNVLITGSTKGIGYALAKEFLKAGDNVIICSRSEERVKYALESLQVETGKQHVVPSVMFERGPTSRN